jgi:transposase InsO family protein
MEVSEATVSMYLARLPKPPSQTWRTFLGNHAKALVSIDLFVLPTATFRLLMVFIVLRHERRQIVHFGVTAHPTAAWVAQQITEAFPWDSAPRYVIHDRDSLYGARVRARIKAMGIEDVVTAPRAPWQNPFVERMIGSIRRECLDHLIVIDERHLRRILASYFDYYHRSRTHLSLGKDSPVHRPVESAKAGEVIALPQVGGLHHRYEHRYERLAA